MALATVAFLLGAVTSLATRWVLVVRLERVGERLGLSEALLGVVAALAADASEDQASISALTQHQKAIGAGVMIGSNVFNLAELLGLGAVVAGFIGLHRKVVLLGGAVGFWLALVCLTAVEGVLSPVVILVVALVVVVRYLVVLGLPDSGAGLLPLPHPRATVDHLDGGPRGTETRGRNSPVTGSTDRCMDGVRCVGHGGRRQCLDGTWGILDPELS